jgi:hypothetical protein
MKFLNEKGTIEEGIPLTKDQVEQRERLIVYFHDVSCGNGYHGTYGEKKCETLANAYVTGDMAKVAISEPAPTQESEPVTVAADNDIPF